MLAEPVILCLYLLASSKEQSSRSMMPAARLEGTSLGMKGFLEGWLRYARRRC